MNIHEVRVISKNDDTLGREVEQDAERTLGRNGLDSVETAKIYKLQGISEEQARYLAHHLLTDPVTQEFQINQFSNYDTGLVVEVAYKPGVMNPETASIIKACKDLGINPEAVDSTIEYTFKGNTDKRYVEDIVGKLLVNDTVQNVVVSKPNNLISQGSVAPVESIPIRSLSDEKLMELSNDKLFLDVNEMGVVKNYFTQLERDPTDIELEIIAARWSEHCGHKTFNAKVIVDGVEKEPLFSRIKNAAKEYYGDDLVLSAFNDNSGVIKFYNGQAICAKVETHNSPSAIEPYGGAMTGSGGVFRDIMGTGKGAKTIISTDMFCFAPPKFRDELLPPGTLNPDYLQRRVIQGVRDYGNRMGIPTGNGSFHYHPDFIAKPTVMVGAYGIMPEEYALQGEPKVGDLVVIIGGRTGRDGIHGATFSSGEMTERTSNVNSSAVQIGNAIEEKRMSDALLEIRDLGLIRALTDCGAAGFSSAIGEMGENIGVTVDISKVPLKYTGLAPWEIWLSESQERMVASVAPENINEFLETCSKYNTEAVVLGEFDGSKRLTINYESETIADLDYDFLSNGLPQRTMYAHWESDFIEELVPESPKDEAEWINRFKKVLSHGNVCSKEPIVRQYDHGVQGGNAVSPFGGIDQNGPNDALVIRPLLNQKFGMVQSHGMNPVLNRINPYEGTKWAIAEAAANYVAVGGNINEAAGVGNYVWPFPDEESMGSLDKAVDAAVDMMHLLKIPVISGKDSLSSTYRAKDGSVIKIPPVYTMSIFGRIPDVEKTMTSDIKQPGKTKLYLVGKPDQNMGGSTYYDVLNGSSSLVPSVDEENLVNVLQNITKVIANEQILSCHDISEGGLATAVAEMCFGGKSGASIRIPERVDPEKFMFSENAGCFVVEVPVETNLREIMPNVPLTPIGFTNTDQEIIVDSGIERLFSEKTDELINAWQAPMKEIFQS